MTDAAKPETGSRGKRSAVLVALLGGAALLVGSGVLLWKMLPTSRNVGEGIAAPGQVVEYLPPDDIPIALPEARLDGIRVALVEGASGSSELTTPGHYEEEVGWWRAWLKSAGAVDSPAASAEVLVLPLAECAGADVRRLIADHLQKGGGIVSTGALGMRNGECGESPDTVLSALVGEGADRSYAWPVQGTGHMVFLGETMIAAGIPAGARIDLSPSMHLVFRGAERSVYYSDFQRRPQRVGQENFFDGALAVSLAGNGRVVAFGFGMSEALPGWSEGIVKLAARNAVNFAAGRPVVQLGTWPDRYVAAAVVAQDVEADYANAAEAIELMEAAEMPTTYFIVGRLARLHPRITRSMIRQGELATHSYNHLPMDQFTDVEQMEELQLSKESTEEYVDVPVRGFRPPQERFNVATLRAWAEIGGDYFFAVDQGRSPVPVFVPFGTDSLVFIGRVIEDDFSLLSREDMRDRGAMVRSLVQQLDEVIAYRGAYMFSYHSHMMAQEQLLPVLQAVVDALKQRPEVWRTNAGDLAAWWRSRAAIDIKVAADGRSATLKNLGESTFSRGSLLVDLPSGERLRLALPEIAPGAQATVALTAAPRTAG